MDDDSRAVDRYRAGEEEAFEELVMKYQRKIYAFVYRITGDAEESKDLTQRTFINALGAVRDFKGSSLFKTWLYQIAMNACRNHLTRERRNDIEIEDSLVRDEAGVLVSMVEKEKRKMVKKALEGLPERQRLSIILRVYEGLSCTETAGVMGCTEGAVKASYHHGVKRLKEMLAEQGYEIA